MFILCGTNIKKTFFINKKSRVYYNIFMHKIHVSEINSTNSLMLQTLSAGTEYEEGTVIYTLRQTAGRGQVGNSWESEADKNIAFSLLLRPEFLPIREQFYLSEIT